MIKYNRIGKQITSVTFITIFLISLFSCASLRLPHASTYKERAKGLCMKFIKVTEGKFLMGVDNKKNYTYKDELPLHNVKLSSYYISTYEVTNKQYSIFCHDTKRELPYNAENRHPNSPVVYVSWEDAVDFCKWLSEISKKEYRLPTEAEWEYAAKGGIKSNSYMYAGSNNINEVATFNTDNLNTQDTLHLKIIDDVGKKKPNELGIYDMSGSVWEWCYDNYSEHYYKNSPLSNPVNLDSSILRVARGGGWLNAPKYHIVSNRDHDYYLKKDLDLGFRVVLVSDKKSQPSPQ